MEGQERRATTHEGEDKESCLAPTLHGELEVSHEYADFVRFPTENLVNRMNEIERNLLNNWYSDRAIGDIRVIVDRLCFEIGKRYDEECAVYVVEEARV